MTRISEKEIQDAIIDFLEVRGYCVWRCNLGGIRSRGRGGNGWAKNPMAGFPDIGACHRAHTGRLIGIEVKREDGVVSDKQRIWHDRLTAAGALVVVARSVEDVRVALLGASIDAANDLLGSKGSITNHNGSGVAG